MGQPATSESEGRACGLPSQTILPMASGGEQLVVAPQGLSARRSFRPSVMRTQPRPRSHATQGMAGSPKAAYEAAAEPDGNEQLAPKMLHVHDVFASNAWSSWPALGAGPMPGRTQWGAALTLGSPPST